MPNLATAVLDRAIDDKGVPDWVHLLPSGRMKARDGRVFDLRDPGAVLLAFQADGIDLPIDYEHQNDTPSARQNGPVPAAGWITALKIEETGIWGRVEWTATAREMIANREYRYVSPAILFNQTTGEVIRLKGAGLVHRPALHLTALASQEEDMDGMSELRNSILKALGLPDDADDQAILDAIQGLASNGSEPDPTKYVPIEALKDLLKDRNAKTATMRETDAKAKVDDALRRGHLTSAMKDWALALCLRDETAFDDFVKTSAAPYAHLLKPSHLSAYPGSATRPTSSAEADAVCSQLGLKPGTISE